MLARLGLQTLLSVVAGPLRARVGGGGGRLHDRPRRRPRAGSTATTRPGGPPIRPRSPSCSRPTRSTTWDRGTHRGAGSTVRSAAATRSRPAGSPAGSRASDSAPTRRSWRSTAAGPSSAGGSPTSRRTARSRAGTTPAGSSTSTRTAAASSTRSGTSRGREAIAATIAPMTATDTAPSLQERYAPQGRCFGCGPANPDGLHIRSFPSAEDPATVVAEWTPEPRPRGVRGRR